MGISIIIVSYNVKNKLRENLQALFSYNKNLDCEVFVVDNNSADGSTAMIISEFPQVKLIANSENLGFAKANNQALQAARGDYLLLLNPDMKILPDTLDNMVDWMRRNEQAWVAGCKLVDKTGAIIKHVRRFPGFLDQIAIIFKLPHLFPAILDNYIINHFDYLNDSKVDSVRGGFFFIRKKAIEKVGLLDERFFVWFEEVDYCRRVYQMGGEVWYTPAAKCIDYVGQSFIQVPRIRTQQYFRDSMLKYFYKWHPVWQYYLLKAAWWLGVIIVRIAEVARLSSRAKT